MFSLTRHRKRVSLLGATLLAFTPAGCASVPKEAPALSAELGGRISETRSMHEQLVRLYMDAKRAEVDRFINDEWLPLFAKNLFDQQAIAKAWDEVVQSKDPSLRVEFIRRLGPRLQSQINAKRAELVQPLNEMETKLVRALEDHYNEMLAMNFALTGLLSAGAKASETQHEILAALKFQDDIGGALSKAEEVTKLLTQGLDALEKNRGRIDQLVDSVGRRSDK